MSYLIIIFNIAIEVPNVNAISLTNRDDLLVVSWIENDGA
jgi:hypothetical protein